MSEKLKEPFEEIWDELENVQPTHVNKETWTAEDMEELIRKGDMECMCGLKRSMFFGIKGMR